MSMTLDGAIAFAARFDHTCLRADTTAHHVYTLCAQALKYGFAAACVPPDRVRQAAAQLAGSSVRVCTVAGFPLGNQTTEIKEAEVEAALLNGAEEVDVVLAVGRFLEGDRRGARSELDRIVRAAQPNVVKVILETGLLNEGEILQACGLCLDAGVDFVKTSSGFGPTGATPADVRAMRAAVGRRCGVKAAGGIRALDQTLELIEAGADRIGSSASTSIMEEWIARRGQAESS